ncbi:MAG: hypothetical protein IM638_13050 [Bacteroidetes bacterium]|nr:hypothetical protein [Bacteroidota bacterium]
MNELKCMFWNVRNLTLQMSRKGKQGGLIKPNQRINAICKLMVSYDLNFLLETGDKRIDYQIKQYIKYQIGAKYQLLTIDTFGESYFIIYDEKKCCFDQNGLFGLTTIKSTKIRQGFWVKLKQTNLVFAVLHAPSPSMRVEDRAQVIQAAKQQLLTARQQKYNVIFFGDLNFKRTEYGKIRESLNPDFTHRGPFELDNTTPLKTSLKTFRTIIKSGDEESQPYDQVWLSKANVGEPQINLKNVKKPENVYSILTFPVTIEFIENGLLKDLEDDVKNYCSYLYLKTKRHQYNGSFVSLSHELGYLQTSIQDYKKLYTSKTYLLSATIKKTWQEIDELLIYFSNKRIIKYRNEGSLDFSISELKKAKLSRYQYETVVKDIISTRKKIDIISAYLEDKDDKVKDLNAACFEYGMSDHFPIEFTVQY